MIQTRDADGNKIMRCLHGDCGGEWKNWNHTKALCHVTGKCGDIKGCKYVSKEWRNDKFLSELQDFQNKSGYFKKMNIWIAAEDPTLPSHRWHQRYSLLFTDYLGKLACLVCSKMTGIGEAERMWKQNKKTRSGQRCRLSTDKTKKQSTISAAHSMNKSQARNAAAKRRGKLMDDEDFKAMKMGKYRLLSCYCCFH